MAGEIVIAFLSLSFNETFLFSMQLSPVDAILRIISQSERNAGYPTQFAI